MLPEKIRPHQIGGDVSSLSYLLAEVERNHAVVLGVEDEHGTGDVVHAAETQTFRDIKRLCCIQGLQFF